ncbi:cysteine proteinase [Piromyces finnis]|uniref:ubiquitinyl hydrolase 1 n=1 Tax=Piromyces finnis TaxID=1754191 RepID=A0A1Y1VGT2_9FUNG|nr:cysteine proteinase [Piromyces finnis]|eukprot:ORX55937.1 cysteine proteinase [Piromyces finnis]
MKDKTEFKDNFMCLFCAKLFCGNHDENHTEKHYKSVGHCVFINPKSKACYCFSCKEEIAVGKNKNLILNEVKNFVETYEKKKRMEEMKEIHKERYMENAKKSIIYPGLRNLRQTCFFNSVMQCLTYTKPFEDIINDKLKIEEGPLTDAFVQFLKTMHEKLKTNTEKQKEGVKISQEVFAPYDLFNQIIAKWSQYRGFQQQDSHELLRRLLDGIRDEQIEALKEKGEEKKKTFIDEIFGGRLVNCIICDSCNLINYTYEPLFDISVSIEDSKKKNNERGSTIGPDNSNIEEKLDNEEYPLVKDEKNKKDIKCILDDIIVEKNENSSVLSIRDCLKQFMDIDVLEGKEACICDNCTKIRYGENKETTKEKTKTNGKKNGKKFTVKYYQDCDEDYTHIKYYTAWDGKNILTFNNNEDSEEEDAIDNENEKEEKKEEKEEKEEKEKRKVVYRRIQKRYFIDEPPKILVINLKRFIQVGMYGRVRKSEKFVDFQPFLKLSPYLSPIKYDESVNPFYRLYGVVVHSGFGVQSGHYFAFISRNIGEWFYASDSIIKPSDWDEVKKSSPYLLFYERIK